MTDLLCLTVTKDRPHFMPWLATVFRRIEWPWGEKHLAVFVDGAAGPYKEMLPAVARRLDQPAPVDISIHATAIYNSLGDHRQHALEVACSIARYKAGLHSTWITWMDDDDWRHPAMAKSVFQATRGLLHSDQLRLIVPRCGRNVLIDVATGRWAETPKQVHWYETMIRADLALELEPFMPVNISEDYYWHQNAVSLAEALGPDAIHTVEWRGTYSSANLFHTTNIACKDFEQAWSTSPHRGKNVTAMVDRFPEEAFMELCMRISNARNQARS